jgi:hypothetical protein
MLFNKIIPAQFMHTNWSHFADLRRNVASCVLDPEYVVSVGLPLFVFRQSCARFIVWYVPGARRSTLLQATRSCLRVGQSER